jgi:hypothetical protein
MKSGQLRHGQLQGGNIPIASGAFGPKIDFGFGYRQFRGSK